MQRADAEISRMTVIISMKLIKEIYSPAFLVSLYASTPAFITVLI